LRTGAHLRDIAGFYSGGVTVRWGLPEIQKSRRSIVVGLRLPRCDTHHIETLAFWLEFLHNASFFHPVGRQWQLITHDHRLPLVDNGCVAIRDGLIAAIGTTAALRESYPAAQFLDARGRLIMPGLINTHMHLYSTFARGMALKDDAPGNFVEILERLWWRLDKVLTLEDVYLSALVAMIDCIKNGTTTIFDHHSSPGAIAGSLFRIAEAAHRTGCAVASAMKLRIATVLRLRTKALRRIVNS